MGTPRGPQGKPRGRRSPQAEPGITIRHKRHCAWQRGETCSCRPSFQAQAWSARDKKPLRRTFARLSEARAWRQEAQVALRRGRLNAPTAITLEDAARTWLEDARAGVARTRSGAPYKPSAIRTYEFALRRYLLPELGALRL